MGDGPLVSRCAPRRAAPLLAVALLAVGCAGSGSSRISSISVDRFVNASTPPRILRDRIAAPDWLYFASVDHGWMGFEKHTYETRDGGKNWLEVKTRPSVPSAPSKPSGACGRADVESVSYWSAEEGYALCGLPSVTDEGFFPQYDHSLWSTSDGGASWHRCRNCRLGDLATTITPDEFGPSPSLQIRFFDRDHGLISPSLAAPDYMTFETNERVGIYATSNGGVSWRSVGLGTLGRSSSWPDWHDGYRVASSGPLGYGGTNGLYVTHDAGASWRKIWPAPVRPTNAISYSSPRVAIGVGSPWIAGVYGEDSQAVLRSTDGGLHWRSWGTIPTKGRLGFVRLSVRSVLAVSYERLAGDRDWSALFRSDDNGRSWRKLPTPSPEVFTNIDQVSFSGANGYAAALRDVFATHDGGKSWEKFHTAVDFDSIAALGGKHVLAAGLSWGHSGIFESNDGGRSWRSVPLFVRGKRVVNGGSYYITSIYPRHLLIKDERNGLDRILMSSDGGKSWEGISFRGRLRVSFEALFRARLYFVTPKLGFIDFGPGWQQLMTRDGGRTWTGLPFKPVRPSLGF
jgi:photosystem II stability/assembly factor-like uncharacterized protein